MCEYEVENALQTALILLRLERPGMKITANQKTNFGVFSDLSCLPQLFESSWRHIRVCEYVFENALQANTKFPVFAEAGEVRHEDYCKTKTNFGVFSVFV